MKTIGQRVRELRENADVSLRELARAIGVSAAFLSDVELGKRYPSDKHLKDIARALGITLAELSEHDTRPPLKDFRQITTSNPEYGYAFRQIIDEQISPKDLMEFLQQRRLRGKREGNRE